VPGFDRGVTVRVVLKCYSNSSVSARYRYCAIGRIATQLMVTGVAQRGSAAKEGGGEKVTVSVAANERRGSSSSERRWGSAFIRGDLSHCCL
jgi:hypothetical protein